MRRGRRRWCRPWPRGYGVLPTPLPPGCATRVGSDIGGSARKEHAMGTRWTNATSATSAAASPARSRAGRRRVMKRPGPSTTGSSTGVPALIVRCRSADDVVAALALARDAGLDVSVRGGGHNVAGRAVADGGVMIDLAEMKAIAVDPDRGDRRGGRRRHLERAQRRHRRARARGDRRCDLDHRHRRPHARRRPRLADGQVRARVRQPGRRRAGDRRRRGARNRRGVAPGPAVGAARRRRQLRRRDHLHLPPAPGGRPSPAG